MDTLTKTCASCRTTRQSQKGIVQQKTTVAVLPNAARHRPSSSSSWKDIVLQRVAQEIVFLSFKVRPIRNGPLSLCKAASLWMLFRVSFFISSLIKPRHGQVARQQQYLYRWWRMTGAEFDTRTIWIRCGRAPPLFGAIKGPYAGRELLPNCTREQVVKSFVFLFRVIYKLVLMNVMPLHHHRFRIVCAERLERWLNDCTGVRYQFIHQMSS